MKGNWFLLLLRIVVVWVIAAKVMDSAGKRKGEDESLLNI